MRWPFALMILGAAASCSRWQTTTTPLPELLGTGGAPGRLRLTPIAGETLVMEGALLRADTIYGLVAHRSAGQQLAGALLGQDVRSLVPRSVAVGDVVRVELRKRDDSATAAAVLLIAAGTVTLFVIGSRSVASLGASPRRLEPVGATYRAVADVGHPCLPGPPACPL
jgi:hypothetical protein